MTLTSEQIKAEVERIVEEKLEDYFRMSRPGFSIESGTSTSGHGISEFMLTTDAIQGLHFYRQGNCKLSSNVCTEIVSGFDQKEKAPAVSIRAKNGNVQIEAKSGSIILKAIDIKVHATDTLHLMAGNKLKLEAPSLEFNADNVSGIGVLDMEFLGGGQLGIHCESWVEVTDGVDIAASDDIMGKLIGMSDQLKKLNVFS